MKNHLKFAAIAAAALLAACGGGGGDSTPAPTPAPAPAQEVPAGVPVALPSGSHAAELLAAVNSQISRCGYAALQNVQDLQKAAQAHADYSRQNGYIIGHDETPGRPGFTGADHRARIRAAGGGAQRAEQSSEGVGDFAGPPGREVTTGLLAAPFHLADLLSGWTEVGVGTVADPSLSVFPAGTRQGVLVLVYGGPKRDGVPPGGVRTFPCEGSQSIPGRGGPETPDPAPDLGGRFGNGLVFDTAQSGSISVTSIELREVSSGQVVPLRRLPANSGDPAWRSVYFPAEVLRGGSRYTVTATGQTWATRDRSGPGVSWSRGYTFTTY